MILGLKVSVSEVIILQSICTSKTYSIYFLKIFLLYQVLVESFEIFVAACGIQFPDQGSNPCPGNEKS